MKLVNCCKTRKKHRKCTRKDKKVFNLPRKFTRKKCNYFKKTRNKGFTVRSSCAPYKMCGGALSNKNAICILEKNKSNITGTIKFSESEDKKIKIKYNIIGLKDGNHGFHIHQYGDLTDECNSACSHFNPNNNNHGSLTSIERHAGDLGNIYSKDGVSSGELIANDLSLNHNKYNILGRMVIIHKDEDDFGKGTGDKMEESLKTGNAGKRLACGIIGLCK